MQQQNYLQPHPQMWQAQAKNGMGTSSLVIGVAAVTAALCSPPGAAGLGLAIVLGVLGTVFGCIGISRARSGIATNRASAIAGVVTSPASIVVAMIAPSVAG